MCDARLNEMIGDDPDDRRRVWVCRMVDLSAVSADGTVGTRARRNAVTDEACALGPVVRFRVARAVHTRGPARLNIATTG